MSKEINPNKIVVISGAGISAESGIKTFRDSGGLWNEYPVYEVASPQGWERNQQLVLNFYNERRDEIKKAQPNDAHYAIAKLEEIYEVVVITQNIDDLHERAGSENVIHVHGEILKARSTSNPELVYELLDQGINLGDRCSEGSQLRPHIVWFGEKIMHYEKCREHLKTAGKVLVVGTSLSVYPAADLVKAARFHAEKYVVSLEIDKKPYGYKFLRAKATKLVPYLCDCWLKGRKAI